MPDAFAESAEVRLHGWRLDMVGHELGEVGAEPQQVGVGLLRRGRGDVVDVPAVHQVLYVGGEALKLVLDDGIQRLAHPFAVTFRSVV